MIPPDRVTVEKLLRGQLDPEAVRALCRQLEDEAEFERMAANGR